MHNAINNFENHMPTYPGFETQRKISTERNKLSVYMEASSSSSSSFFGQSDVLSFGDKLNMEDLQSILVHLRPLMFSSSTSSEKTTNISPYVNQERKGGMKEEGIETEDVTMMEEDTTSSTAGASNSSANASKENAWTKEDHQQVIGLVHLALTLPSVASEAFETVGNIIRQRIEKMSQTSQTSLSFSSTSHQFRKHRNKISSSHFVVSSTPFSPVSLSITLKEIHAQLRQSLQRNGVVWVDVTLKVLIFVSFFFHLFHFFLFT
jgi:hypothetical protein